MSQVGARPGMEGVVIAGVDEDPVEPGGGGGERPQGSAPGVREARGTASSGPASVEGARVPPVIEPGVARAVVAVDEEPAGERAEAAADAARGRSGLRCPRESSSAPG